MSLLQHGYVRAELLQVAEDLHSFVRGPQALNIPRDYFHESNNVMQQGQGNPMIPPGCLQSGPIVEYRAA